MCGQRIFADNYFVWCCALNWKITRFSQKALVFWIVWVKLWRCWSACVKVVLGSWNEDNVVIAQLEPEKPREVSDPATATIKLTDSGTV